MDAGYLLSKRPHGSPDGEWHMREDTSTQLDDAAADLRKVEMLKAVCPFCGQINQKGDLACPRCGMEDTPGTRQATRSKVGPWSVLQHRNPSAPGMNFETLISLIEKGRVTPRSIVRGPTTHQLWRYASKVKGISREFGLCWGCGGEITKSSKVCPGCKRLQDPPLNPDALIERTGAEAAPTASTGMAWPSSGRGGPDLGVMPMPRASEKVEMIEMADHRGSLELAAFGMGAGGSHRHRRPILTALIILFALTILGGCAMYLFDPKDFNTGQQWVTREWHDLVRPARSTPTEPSGALPSDDGRDATPRLANLTPVDSTADARPAAPTTNPTFLSDLSPPPATRPTTRETTAAAATRPSNADATAATRPTAAADVPGGGTQIDIGPPVLTPAPVVTQTPTKPETGTASAALKIDKVAPPSEEIQITPPAALSLDEAKARAGLLRFQAFQATADKNYAQAVKCWEEMAKLPAAAQHSDLQQNLQEARDRLRNPRH